MGVVEAARSAAAGAAGRRLGPDLGPELGRLLLVPLLIGLLLGASRAGIASAFPWGIGIVFWVAASVGVWACLWGGSWIAQRLLEPWRTASWLVLLLGALLGSLPAREIIYGLAAALQEFLIQPRPLRTAPPIEFSFAFALNYLQGWLGVFATWVAVGLAFERWFGAPVPGARAQPARSPTLLPAAPAPPPAGESPLVATATAVAPAQPATPSAAPGQPPAPTSAAPLLERLPERIGREVIALEAEDHYVRVHTDKGSALVHGRLSDAIEELAAIEGVRVHRSYWVRKSAISKARAQGKRLLLKLSNGVEIPVSHSYRELVRQAGIGPR